MEIAFKKKNLNFIKIYFETRQSPNEFFLSDI